MIRTQTIVESTPTLVELDSAEVALLRSMGRRLASKKGWWGQDEDQEEVDRTVISVEGAEAGRWRVRVSDAVGVIRVGDTQLVIEPKIPTNHLLYLLGLSGEFPRLDEQLAAAATSASLWALVATWFVAATERLLRHDLLRDYQDERDELVSARGRVDPQATGSSFYAGRLGLVCDFDEFGLNTPLNRILKAAAAAVAASPILKQDPRRRAQRLLGRLEDVGAMQLADWRVRTDRRSGHYADAIALGRHVLQGQGRTLAHGSDLAWSFLIRTPEMVESGIRALLASALGAKRVTKIGRAATGGALTFNPDLVFDGGRAIGDVKYKLSRGGWDHSDVNQVVTFAEAFRTDAALLVRFRTSTVAERPDLRVGDTVVRELTWLADADLAPVEAAARLVAAVGNWLADQPAPMSA